jgi:nifR3 family TIM-barrel protein
MASGSDQIRALLAKNPVWLAPMAGVNDACFRGICKRMGAGVTYTEMISAAGLHYNFEGDATRRLLTLAPNEETIAVQLFGADPGLIARQAVAVVEHLEGRVAFVDINMGCPVSKVVRKGEGSALMRTPQLASRIVERTVTALTGKGRNQSDVAVTVKFRRGFCEDDETAVAFASQMERAGASALAVHGRYAEQFYRGRSDGSAIARVNDAVSIPVIGSGDVFSPEDAIAMIAREDEGGIGADGVMVARGAQGDPWIFKRIVALRAGETPSNPDPEEIFAVMSEHARCFEHAYGPRALVRMRKHAMWYCAGLPGASVFRARINGISTMGDLESLIDEYRQYLLAHQDLLAYREGQ